MSALFSPIRVKDVTLRNRVVMPPMVVGNNGDDHGCVTEVALEHYRHRAAAGTAMIIVEATDVDEGGRPWKTGRLGAYADKQAAGLSRLAEGIRGEGAAAAIQLLRAARPGIANEFTVEEILAIEGRFAEAAARAVKAGFQAVEVHGAHNVPHDYLLASEYNLRTDAYGGSLAGRARMLVETCERVKGRVGDEALVLCRISIFNKIQERFSAQDFGELIRSLEGAGIDILDISTDGAFKGYFGTDRSLGKWAREFTRLPIIVAGGLGDPQEAERAVAEGHADFAAVGTAMLENADWTRDARAALGEREVPGACSR